MRRLIAFLSTVSILAALAACTPEENNSSGNDNPCPSGAVDLGLGVYWATCNLSKSGFVSSPEAYGAYYAWGETTTKYNYSWSTYKFGTSFPFSMYNLSIRTELMSEDDVAHVKLGGSWRMPTDGEWAVLIANCTWTWTSNYNGTGVAGRIVTSNVEGYEDKSIFLPAAGIRNDTDLDGAGYGGYYWSSSRYTDNPSLAMGVQFYSDRAYRRDYLRCDGLSIRPVSD